MNFINDINSETLIICNNYVKKKILDMHKLIPIKFMTMNEFKSKYLFSYDENTIKYVINRYNIKYEIAHEYIDNLYYVEDKEYGISKLDFLVNLKKELNDNNLLIYNNTFREYVKKINIIIYGIKLNDYYIRMFDKLNYRVIDREYYNYMHDIYEFDTMEDECIYVVNEIAKLIDNGISIKKIKVTNVDDGYYNTLTRLFSLYGLKISIPYKRNLVSYPLVSSFIKLYRDDNLDINECLDKVYEDSNIYHELIKIINKYIKYNDKELLIYKIEHSSIESIHYDNEIEIINYLEYISEDDEYIFMLGFNEGMIPKNYMDTEYITDNIVKYVYLDDTKILNKRLRKDTVNIINSIKNLVITYKLRDYQRGYYPSSLCSNYQVKRVDMTYQDSYSELFDKMKLVSEYDNYFKYGYKSNNFDLLNSNYKINYNSFDNKFSGIDRVMNKLNLSYSKMQIYNKCAFRYYLSDILKLDIFLENFSTVIGSMVHFVMEKCLSNNDMDTDKYVSLFLEDKTFTNKEKFFLEKYKVCIKELLEQVNLEKEYSLFDQALYEKKIDIDYGDNIHFIGIIDKILYYIHDNNTYISLVDYKTGRDDISLQLLKYGINIQLPIYLYLSSKLDFNNPIYCGFYLQKFNITDKDYRLVGYSNSDKDILNIIDKNYDNSKIIKGLKTLKDGSFSKNSKILSNEEINNISIEANKQIQLVIDRIKNNCFDINPKVYDNKNIGCEYCKFKDICFMKKDDTVKIEASQFGGEE